jgi:hypothetical protein
MRWEVAAGSGHDKLATTSFLLAELPIDCCFTEEQLSVHALSGTDRNAERSVGSRKLM